MEVKLATVEISNTHNAPPKTGDQLNEACVDTPMLLLAGAINLEGGDGIELTTKEMMRDLLTLPDTPETKIL